MGGFLRGQTGGSCSEGLPAFSGWLACSEQDQVAQKFPQLGLGLQGLRPRYPLTRLPVLCFLFVVSICHLIGGGGRLTVLLLIFSGVCQVCSRAASNGGVDYHGGLFPRGGTQGEGFFLRWSGIMHRLVHGERHAVLEEGVEGF